MFRLRYSRKDCCSKSRQTFHRMISQSYLQTKQNDETVAKKKFFHLPIFFLLIAKSVVAKNEEEYCAIRYILYVLHTSLLSLLNLC